jgi:hypothetical protein
MTRKFASIALAILLLGSVAAWASDSVSSNVTIAADQRQAVIVNNGGPPGTIQLWYTFTGTALPCGQFAQFNLGLLDQQGTNGASTSYPQNLYLVQSGNGAVSFSPVYPDAAATISVSGPGWTASSTVNVSIDCSKLGTPYDGQDIVGNLNESTDPGAHLNTPTTVQVHIKLIFPTACVKLYSFQADQATGFLASDIVVNAKKGGSITSTNPGQLSVDGLVTNLCDTPAQFDMAVGLDNSWWTNPTGNPGNATFLYSYQGIVDPDTYLLATTGTMLKKGQKLCIENETLQGGASLLMTVHSAMIATNTSQLANPFGFSTTLYTAGSGCTGSPLVGDFDPNPANATSTLPYKLK